MAPGGWFAIHRFGLLQRLAVWHGVTALPPKSPVTPLWRRDHAASAAARWVCVLHPCAATASRSRLTTPREAPSDGPAWEQYESRNWGAGISMEFSSHASCAGFGDLRATALFAVLFARMFQETVQQRSLPLVGSVAMRSQWGRVVGRTRRRPHRPRSAIASAWPPSPQGGGTTSLRGEQQAACRRVTA